LERWAAGGVELWTELERTPGRFALLTGPDSDEVASILADLRGATPLHVGRQLTNSAVRPTEPQIRKQLRGRPVLVGLEILFDPVLGIEPVRLLAGLAKEARPVIAHWPVPTASHPLEYPQGMSPGRGVEEDLHGCLLLRTRPTLFADDAPFTMERFN
jgi:hypothetical protein